MNTLEQAAPKARENLSTLCILNIGRPIRAKVRGGKVWTGILQAYRDDGLIIKKKYGKVLWNWRFKHLTEIEVEVPIHKGLHIITMPD